MGFFRRFCCCLCGGNTDADSAASSSASSSTSTSTSGGSAHIAVRIRDTRSKNEEDSPPLAYAHTSPTDEMLIEMESMLPASSSSASSSSSLYQLPPLDQNPPLTASQLQRAWELSRWSSLELGWRVLADPAPGRGDRYFYFNVWTGETVWNPPAEVVRKRTRANQTFDLTIPGHVAWIGKFAQKFKSHFGIEITLWSTTFASKERRGLLAGHPVHAVQPCLLHLLFYAHVLWNEFSLYPPSFLRAIGLSHIVLADELRYERQSRAAIPLIESGTLLLDPRLEEIMYVTSVLHHELFHMIDCHLIYRSETHSRKRALSNSNNDNDVDFESEDREFDFSTAIDAAESLEPLSLYALNSVSSLHGVPDVAWSKLNVKGFQYGNGGALARGHHMFLSSSLNQSSAGNATTAQLNQGFLNAYSQTAVEEDKAEVYAALIRNSFALLYSPDTDVILKSKAWELRRRLTWFSQAMKDENFWEQLQQHTPHPARPSMKAANKKQGDDNKSSADAPQTSSTTVSSTASASAAVKASSAQSSWQERVDHLGHSYYFNLHTKQTSWIKPQFL